VYENVVDRKVWTTTMTTMMMILFLSSGLNAS